MSNKMKQSFTLRKCCHLLAVVSIWAAMSGTALGRDTAIYNGKLTSDLKANGFTVTGLATPTNGTDAATKEYVDAYIAGNENDPVFTAWKSVDFVSVTNGVATTGAVAKVDASLTAHTADTNNPHKVTASQVGVVLTNGVITIDGEAITPLVEHQSLEGVTNYVDAATNAVMTSVEGKGYLTSESDPTIAITNGTIYIKGEKVTPVSPSDTRELAEAKLGYAKDFSAVAVNVGADQTLVADLTDWPDGQAQIVFITLATGASVHEAIQLVGYPDWVYDRTFAASALLRKNKVYISPLFGIAE